MTAADATSTRFDTPIIGRESDLADLGALLDDHAPLVTFTGRGGVGKTRLAREVLAAHRQLRRGPAAFVELTSVRGPDPTAKTVTHHLGAVFLALGVRTRTEAALWASAHGLAG